ncbi:E3 ubiquitin-protein ligase RNF138-like [Daktulosphaira vitifoliae]|uniref:E3 ubiquitin-protein ligase RNF138-like n=1 Tax=Daktulosphaira vitifoliae TaxID=58002 RepID=UPI0021AA2527|nr:E3 ubiquitin-protein ligase RNF138-like [Daktulosphaira vitifoliae]
MNSKFLSITILLSFFVLSEELSCFGKRKDKPECPICHFPLKTTTTVNCCSSKFCKKCLDGWIKVNKKGKCPVCHNHIDVCFACGNKIPEQEDIYERLSCQKKFCSKCYEWNINSRLCKGCNKTGYLYQTISQNKFENPRKTNE